MNFKVTGQVKRFPGKGGWYYVELSQDLSQDLRPLLKDKWPQLLSAKFKINSTSWDSSIMPIKDGLLFIALPAKIRDTQNIKLDDRVSISVKLK